MRAIPVHFLSAGARCIDTRARHGRRFGMFFRFGAVLTKMICLLAVVWPVSARAQGVGSFEPPLSYMAHGLRCSVPPGRVVTDQNTVDGELIELSGPWRGYDVVTTRVPAQIGISFGIAVRVDPVAQTEPLLAVVRHPPMGADGLTRQTWTIEARPAQAFSVGYLFEDPFEQVPGTWTFSLMRGETEVMRAAFEVRAPEDLPRTLAFCTGGPPTS